jgi:hypothetical protein
VLGNEDLKHPFFGKGVCDMVARQASRACAVGGCVVLSGGVGVGAGCAEGAVLGWAQAAKEEKSPKEKLRTTKVRPPHTELGIFISGPPSLSSVSDFTFNTEVFSLM